jgi:hypothetical protein
MIQLTCTNCKTVLTMDDAFAGGVCRCQHCGAIQTVPSRLKGSASVAKTANAAAGAADRPAKTLYQHRSRAEIGTGLDELADIVASSGSGSGSGLTGQLGGKKQQAAVARANRTQLILAISAVIIIILACAVIWLATRDPRAMRANSSSADAVNEPAAAEVEPTFLGQRIDGRTIIYVVDRGTGTQKSFGDIKDAVLDSIQTLGSDRKFQVIFWNNGSDDAFPTGSPAYATRTNVESARRTFENIGAFGKSDVASAMDKAIRAKPSTLILITGKAWDLEDSFVEKVMNIRKDADVRIHTIAVGGAGDSGAFKSIADRTQGEYREVMEGELRDLVR